MKKNRIFLSVINWNNSEATNAFLASLLPYKEEVHVLLIDNNSTREKLKVDDRFLKELDIEVLHNKTNLGYAGGHNLSIKKARAEGYEYICLSNNDVTLPDTDLFMTLKNSLMSKPDAIIIAPAILTDPNTRAVWYGGGSMSIQKGHVEHLCVGKSYDEISHGAVDKTDFVTGCFVLAKAKDLPLISEEYFLYWEDADLSAKIRSMNRLLLFEPRAYLYHKTSTSLGIRSPHYVYYNLRNQLLFARKWGGRSAIYMALATCLIVGLKYTVLSLRQPQRAPKVALYSGRGILDGLANKKGALS